MTSSEKIGIGPVAICASGILMGLVGIASYFLAWGPMDSTGLELLSGGDGIPSSALRFMPTITLAVMALMLIMSALALTGRGRGISPYGALLLGFVSLVTTVVFGNWIPFDEKMIMSGGPGMYLAMAASCIYILVGVVTYMYRPLPNCPKNP